MSNVIRLHIRLFGVFPICDWPITFSSSTLFGRVRFSVPLLVRALSFKVAPTECWFSYNLCLSPIATILHVITTRSPPVYLRYIHLIETIYSHARTARCIEALQCATIVYSCQLPVIGCYVAGLNYVVGNLIGYTS